MRMSLTRFSLIHTPLTLSCRALQEPDESTQIPDSNVYTTCYNIIGWDAELDEPEYCGAAMSQHAQMCIHCTKEMHRLSVIQAEIRMPQR